MAHSNLSLLRLSLALTVYKLSIFATNGQSAENCVFTDSGGSGLQLDLRALAHTELSLTDQLTPHNTWSFTPCRNALLCDSDTAMALKTETMPEVKCTVLANFDSMQTQPLFDDALERWTFRYQTGNNCGQSPWDFVAYFDCDPDIGDFYVISAGSPNNCSAEMYISSQWACPGEIFTTSQPEEFEVSGGSIFVIAFCGAAIVYLVLGWIICAVKNRKDHSIFDCQANIPHVVFWTKLPALVCAGCTFCKDFFVALCCGESVGNERGLIDEEQNVNPFSNAPTLPVPMGSGSLLDD